MKRNTFLLCAFLFVFTVSSCTTSHSLYTSQTANNETFVDRGKEYQTANTSNLKVIATGLSTEDDSNRVIIGIENKGEERKLAALAAPCSILIHRHSKDGQKDGKQKQLIGNHPQ